MKTTNTSLVRLTVETRNLLIEEAVAAFDRETYEALGDALEALTLELHDSTVRGWHYGCGLAHVMQRVASMLVAYSNVTFRFEECGGGCEIPQPTFTRVVLERAEKLRRLGPISNGDVAAAFLRQASILVEASCQGGAR